MKSLLLDLGVGEAQPSQHAEIFFQDWKGDKEYKIAPPPAIYDELGIAAPKTGDDDVRVEDDTELMCGH